MDADDDSATPADEGDRTPVHLWVVGGLALLWNLVGAFDFLAAQLRFEPYMSAFTEAQLRYFYGFPAWVVVSWAVAVWGALFGAVALLLRSRLAVPLFGASILGLAVTTLHNYGLSEGAAVMGTGGVVFTAAIWIVTVLLYVYARRMTRRGVLD